ncbi:ABC transporter substrate-binding protein [Leadbettera azotonutricia]|uniref:Putative bacterial extracellular solute-binding protein n=1 Tax=Leadbettera azotonutricia (strain ATCC BAA-888 / DSM 13862 / ZAS-9) TaxID=545695 RepID=F5YDA2_LEAAZ|nr:sugar ABC transporter substrate-binding protein [Leadbettera azotonutricia]AEF80346.1 putative bacterial extracellular solute-binding protein [Leadbettera azotonutricia ZAS-9]
MKAIRTVLVLAAVLVIGFTFGACKGGSSKGETINFWMQQYGGNPQGQQDFINGIAAKFKEETGITVNVTYVDWGQAHTKYTLAATGGEAPDVADTFFPYSWVKIGGEKYGLLQIDDVIAEVGSDGFYDVARPECYINGHWYGLPWRGDTRAAVYNQQLFDEFGITEFPKTYAELLDIGKKLTTYNADGSVDRAGFLFSVSQARFDQTWFALLAGHGGKVMNDSYTEFTFNSPAGVESLKFMYDAVFTHHIVPQAVIDPSYDSAQVFMAGKAAIVLGVAPDFFTNVKLNAPQIVPYVRSAIIPSKTGTGPSSIAFAAPVSIFKTTKHPEAAKKWLKYFCSKDVQLEAMKVLGLVNSWLDVMNDSYFQTDPIYKNFTLQTLRTNPGDMPIAEFSEIDAFPSGPLNTMCTQVMAGGDPQTAINECMTKINAIFK